MVKENNLYIVDEMAGVLEVMDLKTYKIIQTKKLGKFPKNFIILN
jgi:hypothetical protein